MATTTTCMNVRVCINNNQKQLEQLNQCLCEWMLLTCVRILVEVIIQSNLSKQLTWQCNNKRVALDGT